MDIEKTRFITRFPIYETYKDKLGYSKEDINSDVIYTLQKRLYAMSDAERSVLGITNEKMDSMNLHNMIREDQIKMVWNKRSNVGKPSYHLHMDIEGDGSFVSVPNPLSTDAEYIPELPEDKMDSRKITISAARSVVNNKHARGFINKFNQIALKGLRLKETDPDEKHKVRLSSEFTEITSKTEGVLTTLFGLLQYGERGFNEFQDLLNGTGLFKFETTTDGQEYLQRLLEEQASLEKAMLETGRNLPGQYLKGGLIMTDEGKVIKSDNPLFDHIAINEGFREDAYKDSQGRWTGGHGFALDVKTDKGIVPHTELIEALSKLKDVNGNAYDIEKLKSGEQKLRIEDSVNIALDTTIRRAHNLVLKHYADIGIMSRGKGLLRIALTDMMYQSGDGGKSYAGPKSKFMKHLKDFIKTGDKKFLGEWGVADPKTALGQMYIDAVAARNRAEGGIYHRLNKNAEFILMWSEGRDVSINYGGLDK